MKLFYVEDSPVNITVMERIAQHLGYELVVARNGAEGRALISPDIDIILVDIGLPDVDGVNLVGDFKKIAPQVPIIAVSAHAMVDEKMRCLNAGCTEYVTKPFGWQAMLDLLRKYG